MKKIQKVLLAVLLVSGFSLTTLNLNAGCDSGGNNWYCNYSDGGNVKTCDKTRATGNDGSYRCAGVEEPTIEL
jgi:hypothetical protein